MAEIRTDGVAGKLSTSDLTTGSTTMNSAGLADLAAVSGSDIAKITLFQTDTNGRITKREVVYVTAHTASATSATISRGQEGTSAQTWNGTSAPDSWVHAPTARDFSPLLASVAYNPATLTSQSTSGSVVALDSTNLTVTFTAPPSGAVLVKLCTNAYANTTSAVSWMLVTHGTTTVISGSRRYATNSAGQVIVTSTVKITGLTPGTSYQWDWAHQTASGSGGATLYGDDGTVGAYGPAVIEVWVA